MIDPSIVGKEVGAVTFPVERSKLAELARAFHEPDPAWSDLDAARAAGFERIPAPPTVTALADQWRAGGSLEMAVAIGADLGRVLHGEAAWEYLQPVSAGDELDARTRVVDVRTSEGKRGGQMTFVVVETDFTNQDGQLVARRRDTMVETGATA